MKRFLPAILLLFLFGCVSSDPAQNLINQQRLIGTWEIHSLVIGGKSISLNNEKSDDCLYIKFAENNNFTVSSDEKEFQEELNKALAVGPFKYIVDGKKIILLVFKGGENKGEISFNFKLGRNLLTLKNIKAKDNVFGQTSLKALFPSLKDMSIVLRRV